MLGGAVIIKRCGALRKDNILPLFPGRNHMPVVAQLFGQPFFLDNFAQPFHGLFTQPIHTLGIFDQGKETAPVVFCPWGALATI